MFHAALHERVALMETNLGEAIRDNTGGSRVMGVTKLLAAISVRAPAATPRARFITVRCGNLLWNKRSVVPLSEDMEVRLR